MQVLINAIDKAVREGVYSLEETATILNEINKMNNFVAQKNQEEKMAKEEVKKVGRPVKKSK